MDFQDLLQDAEQMTAQIDKENVGMPRLQRTINQMLETNKQKLAKTTNYLSSDVNEINASILLAAKGIDAPRLTQTIENLKLQPSVFQSGSQQQQQQQQQQNASAIATSIDSKTGLKSFSTVERSFDLDQLKEIDLKSFLKSEKETCLMSVIEETKNQTLQNVDDLFTTTDDLEWENEKQKIMQELLGSFNLESANSMANLTTSSAFHNTRNMNSSIMSTSVNQPRSIMNDTEMEFSKEIYLYNQKIISKEQPKPDLLTSFVNLVQRCLNDKNIEELWNMIYFMSNLPNVKHEYEKDLNQTELEDLHRKTKLDRDNSSKSQAYFVSQAVIFLEYCFKELLQNTVNANLKQAKIGGAPGTFALVTGYLRLAQSEKYHKGSEEMFDDHQPLWPTIYLCLRCGDIEAARLVAVKTKKDDLIIYFDDLLSSSSSSSSNVRVHLSSNNENKLKLEYKNKIKRSNDHYKRAVYSYLCRMNDDDLRVLDNVDDFLWFKLSIALCNSSTSPIDSKLNISTQSESLTFTDFQNKLSIEFGEKYFVKNRSPFTYLQVLLLTAQFELAIEFLLKYESLVVHGIHMALALFERGLLNLTNTQLFACGESNEPKCLRRINFANLIKMYTRKFEITDPREALQYYYFLRNLPTSQVSKSGRQSKIVSVFAQYVCELALETREFELFFGKLEKNAIRRPGVIDKFINENDAQAIISLVAEEIENKGLVEDSIKLFDLCKEHQRVLELCNEQISHIVTEVNTPNSARDRLKQMVFAIAIRYKTEIHTSLKPVKKSTISTFYLLTDLMTFFDLYHSENWEIAYDTLNKLGVLPKSSINVDASVKEFISYSEEVKRNFPDLILAAMTIISNLFALTNRNTISFQSIENSLYNDRRQILLELKEQAKSLIRFVGCIPYRLSGDINARLLQLEVMMD